MSIEREKKTVMTLLKAQDPVLPPGIDRERLMDVAASAVVMLEMLPPHLYDLAWAMVADGRQRRLKRGMAGVRKAKWLDGDPQVLVSARLTAALFPHVARLWEAETNDRLAQPLLAMMRALEQAVEAPNALVEGRADNLVVDTLEPQALWDLIGLTGLVLREGDDEVKGHGKPLTEDQVAMWSPSEREAVEAWAAAVHLQANDHDDVQVPSVPHVLLPHLAWQA